MRQLFNQLLDSISLLFCDVFGHNPVEEDYHALAALCVRCGKKLRITYDMMYGETYVAEDED